MGWGYAENEDANELCEKNREGPKQVYRYSGDNREHAPQRIR